MEISVLMTVFNGEQWLPEAIESVLGQTYSDFEFIIVNDGSTDATAAILEDAATRDTRIRVFHHENMGVSRSVNRVLPHIRGDWIARFDADDVMLPNRLERQIAFLKENPDIAVASCFADYVDGDGNSVGQYTNPLTSREEVSDWLACGKVIHFIQSGAILRRAVIEQVGGYRPEFSVTEDTDLWNRIAESGHGVIVQPEVLMQVRIHEHSLTRTSLMLQVNQFRWLEDGALRRRSGQPEIDFDTFLANERDGFAIGRINTARRDLGQVFYKRAALARTNGSKVAMIAQLGGALLLSPSHTLRNVWAKGFRQRARALFRTATSDELHHQPIVDQSPGRSGSGAIAGPRLL